MKLETKLKSIIPHTSEERYRVTFFGMTHDGEGWSVNDPWTVMACSSNELLEVLRDRWEVIKVNYGRQLVGSLRDISDDDGRCCLEADGFPVFDVEVV